MSLGTRCLCELPSLCPLPTPNGRSVCLASCGSSGFSLCPPFFSAALEASRGQRPFAPENSGRTLGGQGTRAPAYASLPDDRPQPALRVPFHPSLPSYPPRFESRFAPSRGFVLSFWRFPRGVLLSGRCSQRVRRRACRPSISWAGGGAGARSTVLEEPWMCGVRSTWRDRGDVSEPGSGGSFSRIPRCGR